ADQVGLVARAVATQLDPDTFEMLSRDPLNVASEILSRLDEASPSSSTDSSPKVTASSPAKKYQAPPGSRAYDREATMGEIEQENKRLKKALAQAQTALSAGEGHAGQFWYQHHGLSRIEREVMAMLIEEGLSADEIAAQMGIKPILRLVEPHF
ncbi:MAG: hypothetical protein MUO52_16310, partial [Desulfobacterales bacterium]|nr:hypothetical protein [Desulfobacterales bacterium]